MRQISVYSKVSTSYFLALFCCFSNFSLSIVSIGCTKFLSQNFFPPTAVTIMRATKEILRIKEDLLVFVNCCIIKQFTQILQRLLLCKIASWGYEINLRLVASSSVISIRMKNCPHQSGLFILSHFMVYLKTFHFQIFKGGIRFYCLQ